MITKYISEVIIISIFSLLGIYHPQQTKIIIFPTSRLHVLLHPVPE